MKPDSGKREQISDDSVYSRNRNWRTLRSSKLGSTRILCPDESSSERVFDHLIGVRDEQELARTHRSTSDRCKRTTQRLEGVAHRVARRRAVSAIGRSPYDVPLSSMNHWNGTSARRRERACSGAVSRIIPGLC